MTAISSVLHRQYEPPHYAGNGVLRAMSQMKPASSRAMAASTRGWPLLSLPVSVIYA